MTERTGVFKVNLAGLYHGKHKMLHRHNAGPAFLMEGINNKHIMFNINAQTAED